MKSFLKYVLATVTGIVISVFLIIMVVVVIVAGMVSSLSKDKVVTVANNSVLWVSLNHTIGERTIPNPFEDLPMPGFSSTGNLGLDDIIARIDAAKTDDRIRGVLLDLSTIPASFATLQDIRTALLDFKTSEKFVVAYSEMYSQKAYYLASTADRIYINPEGTLDFRGLVSQVMFMKGALEKLGIEPQVVKVGSYKSAVEPYILDRMSPENKEQVASFMGSIYDHFLAEISASRSIPKDSLFSIADQFKVRTPKDAVHYQLVDGIKYKDELIDELKDLLEMDSDKKINAVTLLKYKPSIEKRTSARDRVAVVYAVGAIGSGEGDESSIGSEQLSRELRKVREDDRVKAVVLRVNSPGGSALASDVIWREVALTKEAKPIIVSMGDVAASGGYYIAAAADSIFAQHNTITGSIGVFGIIPNMQKLLNNKLGVTFDQVRTGSYSDYLTNVDRPLTAEEKYILQNYVNDVYGTFLQRVSDGRNLSVAAVDSIGQGRVWSGAQALQLGLVDRLGSLEDAITSAAAMAKIENYSLVTYPAIKDPLQSLLGSGSTDKIMTWFGKRELGEHYRVVEQVKSAAQQTGIQAVIPYTIEIF